MKHMIDILQLKFFGHKSVLTRDEDQKLHSRIVVEISPINEFENSRKII